MLPKTAQTKRMYTARNTPRRGKLSPPPAREAVFRSYAAMRKNHAMNRQNTPPSGRACTLPLHRCAESAVQGVSLVVMIPHLPHRRKRGFWEIEVLRAVGTEVDERRETRDMNGDYEAMWLCQCLIVSRLGSSLVYRLMSARTRLFRSRRRVRARHVTYCNM